MSELTKLVNIGKVLENQLEQVGINSYDELVNRGTKQTWLDIQKIDSSACMHRLLALEGAIQGVKKSELSDDIKKELKEFYNEHKL